MSERSRFIRQSFLKSLLGPGAADPDTAARATRELGPDPFFESWSRGRQVFPKDVPVPDTADASVILPETAARVLDLLRQATARQPLSPRLAPDVMPEPPRRVSAAEGAAQLDMGGGAATAASPEDQSAFRELLENIVRRQQPAEDVRMGTMYRNAEVPLPRPEDQWVFAPGDIPAGASPRPFYFDARTKQYMEDVPDPATGGTVAQPITPVRVSSQDPETGNPVDGFILGDGATGGPSIVYDEAGNPIGSATYQAVNAPLDPASDLANQALVQPLADAIRQAVAAFDSGEGVHPDTLRRINAELRDLSPNFEPVLEAALGVDFSERHLPINPLNRFRELAADPAGVVRNANQERIANWQQSLEDMQKEPGWWAHMLGAKQPGATPADALSSALADARENSSAIPPQLQAGSPAEAQYALLQRVRAAEEALNTFRATTLPQRQAAADAAALAMHSSAPEAAFDNKLAYKEAMAALRSESVADYEKELANAVLQAGNADQLFRQFPEAEQQQAAASFADRSSFLANLASERPDLAPQLHDAAFRIAMEPVTRAEMLAGGVSAGDMTRALAEIESLRSRYLRGVVNEAPAVQAAIAAARTPPPPRPPMRPATIEVQPETPARPTVGEVEDADALMAELRQDTTYTPDPDEAVLTADEAAEEAGVPKHALPAALSGSGEERAKAVTGSYDVTPGWEKTKKFQAAREWEARRNFLLGNDDPEAGPLGLNVLKELLADAEADVAAGNKLISPSEIQDLEAKIKKRREQFQDHMSASPKAPWDGSGQGKRQYETKSYRDTVGFARGQGMEFLGRHAAGLNDMESAVNANEIAAAADEGLSPFAEKIIRDSLERVGGPEANKLQAADVDIRDYQGINPTGMSNPQNPSRSRGAEIGAFEARVSRAPMGPKQGGIAVSIRESDRYKPLVEAADARIAELQQKLNELPEVRDNRKFSLSDDDFYGGMPNMGDEANPVFATSFDSNEIVWPDGVRTDWNGDVIDPVAQEYRQAVAARRDLEAQMAREHNDAFGKRPPSSSIEVNPLGLPTFQGKNPERVQKAARALVKYAPSLYPDVGSATAAIRSEIDELGGSPLMVAINRFVNSYDLAALYRSPDGLAAATAIQTEAKRVREVFGGQRRMSIKETDDGLVATEAGRVAERRLPEKPAPKEEAPAEDGAKGTDVGEIKSVDGKPSTPKADSVPPASGSASSSPSTPKGDRIPPATPGGASPPPSAGTASTTAAGDAGTPATPGGDKVPRRTRKAAASSEPASDAPSEAAQQTRMGSMWQRLRGMLGMGPRTPDGTPVQPANTPSTPAPEAASGGAGGAGTPPPAAAAASAAPEQPKKGRGGRKSASTPKDAAAAGGGAGGKPPETPGGESPSDPEKKPSGKTEQPSKKSGAAGKSAPRTYAGKLASRAKGAAKLGVGAAVVGAPFAGYQYLTTPEDKFLELPPGGVGGGDDAGRSGPAGIDVDDGAVAVPVSPPSEDITVAEGGDGSVAEIQQALARIRKQRRQGGRQSYQILGSMH